MMVDFCRDSQFMNHDRLQFETIDSIGTVGD